MQSSTYALPALLGLVSHGVYHYREPHLFTVPLVASLLLGPLTLWQTLSTPGSAFSTQIFSIFASYIVVYFAAMGSGIAAYRCTMLHPLYHVPGPFMCRLTQLWLVKSLVRGKTRFDIQALHDRYGDIVRIGPDEVSIRNADATMQIVGGKSWQKGPSYDNTASAPGAHETALIALRDHKDHAVRRRVWDKAFSISSLKEYQGPIQTRLNQLRTYIQQREGQTIDLHVTMGYFVYDVMSDLAYGGGGDMILKATDGGILHDLSETVGLAGIIKVAPWIRPIAELAPSAKTASQFRSFAKSMFMKRFQQFESEGNVDKSDVFSYLLGKGQDTTASPVKLSTKELAADSALVIVAGADTTRTVLTTVFHYMLKSPHLYRELQAALDEAFGLDDSPTADALATIPLLNAYIDEGLRMNPPLPFHVQRVVPAEGAIVAGVYLPPGTCVRMAIYAMHRDTRYFKNPDEYSPRRWLKEGQDELGPEANKNAFLPFIYGPYHCPGKQFAYQEMRLLLATIIRNWDMKPSPEYNSQSFEASWEDRTITDLLGPFKVIMVPRDRKKGM